MYCWLNIHGINYHLFTYHVYFLKLPIHKLMDDVLFYQFLILITSHSPLQNKGKVSILTLFIRNGVRNIQYSVETWKCSKSHNIYVCQGKDKNDSHLICRRSYFLQYWIFVIDNFMEARSVLKYKIKYFRNIVIK